jgi:hypothetical protein
VKEAAELQQKERVLVGEGPALLCRETKRFAID